MTDSRKTSPNLAPNASTQGDIKLDQKSNAPDNKLLLKIDGSDADDIKIDASLKRWEVALLEAEAIEKLSKENLDEKKRVRLYKGGRSLFERKALQAEVKTAVDTAHAPAHIRNVIAVQAQYLNSTKTNIGEFESTDSKAKDLKKEDAKHLIERIFRNIEILTDQVETIHVSANFDVMSDPSSPAHQLFLMKEDKKNEVTRLAMPEFSFYPRKEQGPLSVVDFNELLKRIETMASKRTPNLHLLLSSFPVLDAANNLHNVTAYVECGEKPQITVVTKAIASLKDLYYPNTRIPFFSGGSEPELFSIELRNQGTALCKQLFPDKFGDLTVETIDSLIELCSCNEDYPPPPQLITLLSSLRRHVDDKTLHAGNAAVYSWKISHFLGLPNYALDIDIKVEDNKDIKTLAGESQYSFQTSDILSYLDDHPQMITDEKELEVIKRIRENPANEAFADYQALVAIRSRLIMAKIISEEEIKRIKTGQKTEDLLAFYKHYRIELLQTEAPFQNELDRVEKAFNENLPPPAADLIKLKDWRNQ